MLPFFDAAAIAGALDFPFLVDSLEAAHRRARIEAADTMMGPADAQYFIRNAVDSGRYMASKLITSFPGNLGGALPAVQAVCVLFDGRDGRPLAVLDGTALTWWRTAADSALGAKLLSRPDPRAMLIVGAGEMAAWLARAHRAVRPTLARAMIWNRTRDRAEALARRLAAEGLSAEVVEDLDAATREADLVVTCTRSREPLVKGANLKAGAHLDLVGGYTPQTREADDEAARRARIYVDLRQSAFHGVGDILSPIASGAIAERDVLGDLYDLASGGVGGRRSGADITFFKNAGGGHLDLMTAEAVVTRKKT